MRNTLSASGTMDGSWVAMTSVLPASRVSSSSRDLSTARRIINTLGRFIGVRNEVGKVITTFEHDLDHQGAVDPINISIDASGYPPGQYNLLVTVQDNVSGQIATKDVTFIVSK